MAPGSRLQLSQEQVQAIARALGEPRRLTILQQIAAQPELACSALNAKECLSPATISHHLKELQEAGLVEGERDGRSMRLRLRRDVWEAYLRALSAL